MTSPALIIDGDTIEIAGERIRLHGIDAPESKQTCTDADGSLSRRQRTNPGTKGGALGHFKAFSGVFLRVGLGFQDGVADPLVDGRIRKAH